MAIEGEKQGLATVLEGAAGAASGDLAAAEQGDLLSETAEMIQAWELGVGGGPLDEPLAAMAELRGQVRRGPGRPKGARNRRTAEWSALILSTKRSPLLVLTDFYSMPVEELAGRLGCDRLEAARLQITAATAVAPYVHQKLPQGLDLGVVGEDGQRMTPRFVVELSGAEPGSLTVDESEQNQRVIDLVPEELDSDELDSGAETRADAGGTADRPADLGSV